MQVETSNIFSFSDILVLERINYLEERDSHRRALLLPLHAIFPQQYQSSCIVSYKFPQCTFKITCCQARFLNQRLGQKYHFADQNVSLWWLPKSQISQILIQSQSTCTMPKALTKTKTKHGKFLQEIQPASYQRGKDVNV